MPTSSLPATRYLPVRARLLDRFEYDNTIAALLGDTSNLADGFPADIPQWGFTTNADRNVESVLAQRLADAAESLAASALDRLDRLLPCDPSLTDELSCAKDFIETFATKAYRRPLDDDDRALLLDAFSSAPDFKGGIQLVLETILESASFLYVTEIGADPGADAASDATLTPHETASALSYLVLGAPPDDDLLAAAADDRLGDPSALRAQVERLLGDTRARAQVRRFYLEWFELADLEHTRKDEDHYPMYAALTPSMLAETGAFVEDLVFAGDGSLASLLGADSTYVDQAMADFYGLDLTIPTGQLARASLAGKGRAGILTQASFLSAHGDSILSSPIKRGAFIRTRILCQTLPDPPVGVALDPPGDAPPGSTTREVFDAHTRAPECAGCHSFIDPIGNAFEHFDAMGGYRDKEGDQTVDSSGRLTGTVASDGDFDGALDLDPMLAGSAEAKQCFARMFFRFASGQGDPAVEQKFLDALPSPAPTDYKGLLNAYVGSDVFTRRERR